MMKIIDYGYDCEGVGKQDGKVCFVPFALKEEEIEFSVMKENSSFIKGKLTKIISPSEKRISAPCKYFGKCGGCALQNVNLEKENEIKTQIARTHFKKIGYNGEINLNWQNDYAYRNKIKLFCGKDGLGLKEIESNTVVPIDKCLIANDRINECIKFCQDFVKAKNLQEEIDTLLIRSEGDDLLLHFTFKRDVDVDFQGLQIMLGAGSGIYKSIIGGQPVHVLGAKFLHEQIFGVNISYRVNTFKQVNDKVALALYDKVVKIIKGNEVINAYSGAGLLTAIIAKQGKKCIGIEIGDSEHEDAEKLKIENGLNKMINFHGDCNDVLPKVISKSTSTVIIDPARKGCDAEVMKVINQSNAERVIYISCNIPSQVRDIKFLDKYEIATVELYNMFPKTAKVECLVILNKKTSKSCKKKLNEL